MSAVIDLDYGNTGPSASSTVAGLILLWLVLLVVVVVVVVGAVVGAVVVAGAAVAGAAVDATVATVVTEGGRQWFESEASSAKVATRWNRSETHDMVQCLGLGQEADRRKQTLMAKDRSAVMDMKLVDATGYYSVAP